MRPRRPPPRPARIAESASASPTAHTPPKQMSTGRATRPSSRPGGKEDRSLDRVPDHDADGGGGAGWPPASRPWSPPAARRRARRRPRPPRPVRRPRPVASTHVHLRRRHQQPRWDPGRPARSGGQHVLVVNVAPKCGLTPQTRPRAAPREAHAGLHRPGRAVQPVPRPGADRRGDRRVLLDHLRRHLPADREGRGQRRRPPPALRSSSPKADADGHTGETRWNFEKFLVSPSGEWWSAEPDRRPRGTRGRGGHRSGPAGLIGRPGFGSEVRIGSVTGSMTQTTFEELGWAPSSPPPSLTAASTAFPIQALTIADALAGRVRQGQDRLRQDARLRAAAAPARFAEPLPRPPSCSSPPRALPAGPRRAGPPG